MCICVWCMCGKCMCVSICMNVEARARCWVSSVSPIVLLCESVPHWGWSPLSWLSWFCWKLSGSTCICAPALATDRGSHGQLFMCVLGIWTRVLQSLGLPSKSHLPTFHFVSETGFPIVIRDSLVCRGWTANSRQPSISAPQRGLQEPAPHPALLVGVGGQTPALILMCQALYWLSCLLSP